VLDDLDNVNEAAVPMELYVERKPRSLEVVREGTIARYQVSVDPGLRHSADIFAGVKVKSHILI
jgi:hypothetical protein